MGRREFLSICSATLMSPWLLKVLPSSPLVKIARAFERPMPEKKDDQAHEAWLKLMVEKALETDLAICDPHHHLWQGYLLEGLLADIAGGHNVVKTVYVEAWGRNQDVGPVKRTPVEETAFAVSQSARKQSRTEVAAGIVGYADLMAGNDLIPLLEAHMTAGKGRFRGVRAASRRGTGPMADPAYRRGCAALHRLGLSLDAYVPYGNFKELADLAHAFPDMPIIANHLGNPAGIGAGDEKSREVIAAWKEGVRILTPCPNVYMKLGGLGMTSFDFGWNRKATPPDSNTLAKEMTPLLTYCIEQLGPERCMFESNFPVDRESYDYTVLWNAFKRMTKEFSESERSALFYDTAVKAYRL